MGRDFTDFVTEGRELMQARDKNSWRLGDLACDFEVTVGRPTDQDAPTLGDLAREWDVETPRVSEWRNVAKFYPRNVRTHEGLSWSHYNMARRASDGDLNNALELLDAADRLHLGTRAFKRYLDGVYYEGEWQGDQPGWMQAVTPRGKRLWVTISEMRD